MKRPFLAGTISREDFLSPSANWKAQSEEKFWILKTRNSFCSLRKRDSYPKTFLLQKKGAFLLGYAEPKLYSQLEQLAQFEKLTKLIKKWGQESHREYFLILIENNPSRLKIFRDALCTLPIFYFKKKEGLSFSNLFHFLLPFIKEEEEIGIDFQTLSEYLLALPRANRNSTILNVIKILGERSTLTYNGNKLLQLPSPAPVISEKSTSEQPQQLFEKKLRETLIRAWNKLPSGTKIGFEISGGVDSATALGFYSIRNPKIKFQAFSMVFPEKEFESQIKKLESLEQSFNIEIKTTPLKDNYPLSSQAKIEERQPFYPAREIYSEALLDEIKLAKEYGIELLFTGIGGDELFKIDPREPEGHQGEKEVEFRRSLNLPSFFTSFFEQKFLENLPFKTSFPTPLIPYSVHEANLARNNIFIENDIWPLSPLASAELTYFCRSLPQKLRNEKRILKNYQQSKGFPKEIFSSKINEDFSLFFKKSIKKPYFKKLFKNLLSKSALADLGLINKQKLNQVYLNYYQSESNQVINPIHFYTITVAEILLQDLRQ